MIRILTITFALFATLAFAGPESNFLLDQTSLIRDATPDDIPAVHGMVVELADYEKKDLKAIGATPEKLLQHGFGEPRYFRLKVVELDGQVVGYAMYFNTYRGCEGAPVLYLEDLYVKPEHRRRGFATQLMAHLAKEALATNCIFMEWNVFAWNEPAIALFEKKLGGELRRELIPVKLKGPEIQRLAEQAQ